MRQHAVPQNVISFEDRLIGEFTIRQFVILAIGAVIIFGLYLSPIPVIAQYSLMFIVGVISAALALLKIQGMYLDIWLKNLILALFGPTQFLWKKEEVIPAILLESTIPLTTQTNTGSEKIVPDFSLFSPQEKEPLDVEEQEFINKLDFSAPVGPQIITSVVEEVVRPENIKEEIGWETFETVPAPKIIPPSVKMAVPAAHLGPSTLIVPIPPREIPVPLPEKPTPKKQAPAEEASKYPVRKQVEMEPKNVITPLASEINFALKPVFTLSLAGKHPSYTSGLTNLRINRKLKNIYVAKGKPLPIVGEKQIMPSREFKQRFQAQTVEPENLAFGFVPFEIDKKTQAEQPTTIHTVVIQPKKDTTDNVSLTEFTETPHLPKPPIAVPQKQPPATIPAPPAPMAPPAPPPPPVQTTEPAKTAVTIPEIKEPVPPKAVPLPPVFKPPKQKMVVSSSLLMQKGSPVKITIPNIIYGSVVEQNENLIEDVIIIVKDQRNIPVRALKTNHLGQFMTATPLTAGKYQIEFEKTGYNFDIIEMELNGEVLAPLTIVAKG